MDSSARSRARSRNLAVLSCLVASRLIQVTAGSLVQLSLGKGQLRCPIECHALHWAGYVVLICLAMCGVANVWQFLLMKLLLLDNNLWGGSFANRWERNAVKRVPTIPVFAY